MFFKTHILLLRIINPNSVSDIRGTNLKKEKSNGREMKVFDV
jgi:hypothetical protein